MMDQIFLFLFVIPVLIAFLLLVFHSIQFLGKRDTAILFLLGFVYGFIREAVRLNRHYIFVQKNLAVFGVPLIPVFGWLYTFYISYFLAIKSLKIDPYKQSVLILRQNFFKVLTLITIYSAAIDFAIEGVALNLGWWYLHDMELLLGKGTITLGYSYTPFLFFYLYFLIRFPPLRNKKKITALALLFLTDYIFDNNDIESLILDYIINPIYIQNSNPLLNFTTLSTIFYISFKMLVCGSIYIFIQTKCIRKVNLLNFLFIFYFIISIGFLLLPADDFIRNTFNLCVNIIIFSVYSFFAYQIFQEKTSKGRNDGTE